MPVIVEKLTGVLRACCAMVLIIVIAAGADGCRSHEHAAGRVEDGPVHAGAQPQRVAADETRVAAVADLSHTHAHGDHEHAHDDSGAGHTHAGEDHAMMHPSYDASAACMCAAAMDHHGWCPRCNVGYIAGVKVESAKLFSTVDAHGHYVELDLFKAEHCKDAIANDGYCTPCRMGFIKGLAYFTPLTHGLAKGVTVQKAGLQCERCSTLVGSHGWCDRCGRGVVGNVMWRDRAVYETTAREFEIFKTALAKAPSCDGCAAGMVLHSSCPFCLIDYP